MQGWPRERDTVLYYTSFLFFFLFFLSGEIWDSGGRIVLHGSNAGAVYVGRGLPQLV